MPKLLRSSETAGCGATIELDSREVVYVSIAQIGVLVRLWDMRGGLIKSLLSNFFGPKLYSESNVYKNVRTAQALSVMFPERLRFKNPVLAAFSNAIWHCSSAAEVCTVLNEVATKAPNETSGSEATPAPKKKKTIEEVITAYTTLLKQSPVAVIDVSMLPIPKKQMKVLLKSLYAKATTPELKDHIEASFMFLSAFQEGVGPRPIEMAWEKLCMTEADALQVEWKRCLVGCFAENERVPY